MVMLAGTKAQLEKAQSALKAYDRIMQENAGTPWEILAKREKLTALGLEWQPTRD